MESTVDVGKRKKIGIICGSGPEAGMYLWSLILEKTRDHFGEKFRGDIDMPYVEIISDPRLGESMDIRNIKDKERLWIYLDEDIGKIENNVDYFVITCYTLHIFEPDILVSDQRKNKFVSLTQCLVKMLNTLPNESVALLHANVLSQDLCPLHRSFGNKKNIETPDKNEIQYLVYEVKKNGIQNEVLENKLSELINKLISKIVVIGCTELPMIRRINTSKKYIDCIDVVANQLVQNVFCCIS